MSETPEARPDSDEDTEGSVLLAAALDVVVAGRPERIEDGLLALAPPELRQAIVGARAVLGTLGRCFPPEAPSLELRARLLDTMTRRFPRRALVVIDMIHDHLDPGALLEVPRARAIVPALEARIAAARASNVPVIYVVDEHDPDDPDLDAWGTHAVRGTRGNEVWTPLAPRPGDRVVKKPSYSAFFQSDLDRVLEELHVDTLVLTGCLTELGLHATATDAFQRGFAIEVPPDAQAGSSEHAERAALFTLQVMAPFGPSRRELLARVAA